MFVIAPWYCPATRLANVSPGPKIDRWSGMKLPITCETAIASPSARPSPRITAATTPPRTVGMMTVRTISQRVAPRPMDASSRSSGTPRNSSRQIEVVIGMVMIVSTMIAVKTVDSTLSWPPLKIGIQPRKLLRNGSTRCASNGGSTKMPHSPTTTLGTAASISTRVPTGPRAAGGASSLRKSAIAIESGAARSIAPNDVMSVPMIRSRAPNWFSGAFQTLSVTKSRWNALIAGQAPTKTRQMIAKTVTTPSSAASAVITCSTASPMRSPKRRVWPSAAGAVTEAASIAASIPVRDNGPRHGHHLVTRRSHPRHPRYVSARRHWTRDDDGLEEAERTGGDPAHGDAGARARAGDTAAGVRDRRPDRFIRQVGRSRRRLDRHLQERDHRADRTFRMREVDRAPLSEPHE